MMGTKIVNGERVELSVEELTEIEAKRQTTAGATPPKRPLVRWVFMAALDDYKTAIEQIIAAMPKTTPEEIETEKLIRNKWEHGPVFHYDHADTQGIVQVIQAQEPTFDPEAVWAAGEAIQYGGGA